MTKPNSLRAGCKDVFNAFLVFCACYAGIFELPVITKTIWVPNRLIAYSKAIACKDYNQWVHFYEDDVRFERLWRNPKKYLPLLKRFNGVILPDFSLYRDMPYVMQLWNIYRSRALGAWLQHNDIKVIVNVRYADQRTFKVCCDGVAVGSTIAVGSHGLLKDPEDKAYFIEGLAMVVDKLNPSTIVVYGSAPSLIFDKYRNRGINVVVFESEFASSRKKVN